MVRGTLDYTFPRWEFDGGYPLPACWRVLEIAGVLFFRVLARVGNCPCRKGGAGVLSLPLPSFGAVVRWGVPHWSVLGLVVIIFS